MGSWDSGLHPRDERGRFGSGSGHKKTTEAEKAAGNAALTDFHPHRFANNTEASAYLRQNKPKLPAAQRNAVQRYTGDSFLDTNKRLRAGDASDPEFARIDKAMQPLPEDLMVTRHVQPEAFGLNAGNLDHIQNLTGYTIADKAYASTSIGDPYGGGLGGVTMHIVAPKGTPAVLTAGLSNNPHEREILLSRNQPMAIAKVAKNNRGGWDMYLIALPKDTQ
jgi:ADP-ribosyltransferase exoenzyme